MTGNETGPLMVDWLPGRFAAARLDTGDAIPGWATEHGELLCITRTPHELSIVAPEELVPGDCRAERGFAALRVAGPLDFAQVGILAGLTQLLASAEIPVLAISTYDTDYLLIRVDHAHDAAAALAQIATIRGTPPA